VHEATTKKRAPAKQQPYEPRKPQTRGSMRENVPPRHNFVVELRTTFTDGVASRTENIR